MSRYQKRISAQIDKLVEKMTGDELVEIGVGLIGRGLFRESSKNGVKSAAALADAVSSTTTAMHLDFYRAANKEAAE